MAFKEGLSTNGLVMPAYFPVTPYEAIHASIQPRAQQQNSLYEQFAGAWNAVAYRYLAMLEFGSSFTRSIADTETGVTPRVRYEQENDLFGFFSNGFSIFEATFFGLFTIGAFLVPANFPLATPKDQQAVTPVRTRDAFARAFNGDSILTTFDWLFAESSYKEWREIRNVLTHRAAPGRRMYLSIGSSEELPDEWKLHDIRLDETTTESRRTALDALLNRLLDATATFVAARFK